MAVSHKNAGRTHARVVAGQVPAGRVTQPPESVGAGDEEQHSSSADVSVVDPELGEHKDAWSESDSDPDVQPYAKWQDTFAMALREELNFEVVERGVQQWNNDPVTRRWSDKAVGADAGDDAAVARKAVVVPDTGPSRRTQAGVAGCP